MTITRDELIEILARHDAAFDGRPFDGLGAADKKRYRDRCVGQLRTISASRLAVVPVRGAFDDAVPDIVEVARDNDEGFDDFELSPSEAASNATLAIYGALVTADLAKEPRR